jgi:glycosyltransferase involved in cell wall biosynthesis
VRLAFLSSEFVTDSPDSGGLANYLHRMGRLLVERGHEVEVFIPSTAQPAYVDHHGIGVHRVRVPPISVAQLWRIRLARGKRSVDWFALRLQARALAEALEKRHQEKPFRLVQSADYCAVGLEVAKRQGRRHVMRCSSAADLYESEAWARSVAVRDRSALELLSMRRADAVYAPSAYLADHFLQKHGLKVAVIRPPAAIETVRDVPRPEWLPSRFILHYGQLSRRKGTIWLIEALRNVFEQQPEVSVVLAGKDFTGGLGSKLAVLGSHRNNVLALYPLPKEQMYAVLRAASACVVPSLVDNLPNTAIESLMCGIPVIGTKGASIDELVVDGVTGDLVPLEDVTGLAEALLRHWRGESCAKKGFSFSGGIADEMEPERAVQALLAMGQDETPKQ